MGKVNKGGQNQKIQKTVQEGKEILNKPNPYKAVRGRREGNKQIFRSQADFGGSGLPKERIVKTERKGKSKFQNTQDFQFERRNPDLNKHVDNIRLAIE